MVKVREQPDMSFSGDFVTFGCSQYDLSSRDSGSQPAVQDPKDKPDRGYHIIKGIRKLYGIIFSDSHLILLCNTG